MQNPTPDAVRLMHDSLLTLSKIEANGFYIDVPYLDRTIDEITVQIKQLETDFKRTQLYREWKRAYGDRLKLSARNQLSRVLFDILKHPYPKILGKTDSYEEGDKYKADKDVLSYVKDPYVGKYLRIEKLKKVKSTYLLGLRREVESDSLVHPSYSLNNNRSLRGACNDPNMMNIPVRDLESKKLVRQAIIPRSKKRAIVEIDFKGAEVCIAACYNHDPVLIEYIKNPLKDMHRDMAAEIFCCKQKHVSDDARYNAKNKFVFPEFYGSFFAQCGPDLWKSIDEFKLEVNGIPMEKWLKMKGIRKLGDYDPDIRPERGTFLAHVKEVEDSFWHERFVVYDQWKRDWFQQYLKRGWFRMLSGFVVHGLYGRKEVINYPVQGSAFHCLLWCMNRLQRWIEKRRMKSLIIGQIYDSMLGDVPLDEIEPFMQKAKQIITVDLPKAWKWIIVPLVVEAEMSPPGLSWNDKVKVSI